MFRLIRVLHVMFLLAGSLVLSESASVPQDGLVLWIEAARQGEARERAGLPEVRHLGGVDLVLDHREAAVRGVQLNPAQRPVFISDGGAAYLKFDGKDDFVGFRKAGGQAKEVTIFLLAAPKSNPGYFTGMLGTAAAGRNDYTSGINFDFGPAGTTNLSVLNVEAAGATGARDLLTPGFFNAAERPFGDFHVFTVRAGIGEKGVEVFLDGFKGGERERVESVISLEQMVLGGRIYSNDANQPPFAQGFFEGAIAELLVYERAVADEERRAIEQHLLEKTVGINALLHGAKGHALETVENAPVVQMLAPGFKVKELPLGMANLNNVRYRHDGKLVALGYDGRIYLLSDRDGDGLEDQREFFWEKDTLKGAVGMALTPAGDPRGDGVFVASKGKVSFILDRDRDGRAEEEKVIATGWPAAFHSVDTLGLAIDPKDGSIYFGLGCANFADAYLVDKATGRSNYRLEDIRGTIQRLSADFTRQETICTGVRFTCALAFNDEGDLFATEQEGATWLPNGNPLDELLHIQRDKHYGFPPRHPKHLPNVIDEPPVIEYGPQHQSTVGMVFNEGVNGGPHFGPRHWKGDALVSGAARGKIWRTKLAKTPLGYVAQNHLIACLGLITIDSCVSPEGDLVVVCHSGPPDWGTGPTGEGRIFKIRYSGREIPQPVSAWAAAPDEFRIAFDRALELGDWVNAQGKIKVEAGAQVAAGDRFEVIRPGYQVVRDQMAMPRRWVEVLGLTLTEDRRTLVLRVARQTEPVNYAITLPLPESWRQRGGIAQHPEMDLLVTLNGLSAVARGDGGRELRTVLPHPSVAASAKLTQGSAEHEAFIRHAREKGMSLSGSVDASNPFVPAVQPGSRLDWDMSKDLFASALFGVETDFAAAQGLREKSESRFVSVEQLEVNHPGSGANGLFLAREDLRSPLSTGRIYVPWAEHERAPNDELAAKSRDRTDVKGNWLRGRGLFFQEAGCATCHTIRDEGFAFGPDLSNLIHRDRDSVLQDIVNPSATINPDHSGTEVILRDGTVLAGFVRSNEGDTISIRLPAGAEAEIRRGDIARMEPSKTSLMTEGVVDALTPEQMEDLLTFLLSNPLEPAVITRTDPLPPPPRRMEEVTRVLEASESKQGEGRPLHILLCAGPKDHGPDEHDYPLWLERWSRLFAMADNVTVSTAEGFPTQERLARADVAVFYNANPGWDGAKAAALDEYHERGGGAVYIHYAVDGGKDPAAAAERIGLAFTLSSRFRHGEFDLVFAPEPHPITQGFSTLHFTDETYWRMRGDISRLNVLGTSIEDGAPQPELWTLERKKSRIVGCIPGHYTWTFDDPLYRMLVFRAICWAAREENVDRLAPLATVGARVMP